MKSLCTIVLWGQPSQPNGEVIGFNVQFSIPGIWNGALYRKQMDDIHHMVQDSDKPSEYSDSQIFVAVSTSRHKVYNYIHLVLLLAA